MPNRPPEPGQWYQPKDKGQRFCVVGIDPHSQAVEVQHFDGDIEEFSVDEWRALDIEPAEQPENWIGALDIAERDDLGTEITDTRREDWQEPAEEFRRNTEESASRGGDDYGEGHMEEQPLESLEVTAQAGGVAPGAIPNNVIRRPDGVLEEIFDDVWYAEYKEDPNSGLWHVEVFKHDVPHWHEIDFESLEDAVEAARNYYTQV